jgi:glycosyltransferase involved in cell wall biosynthesis
MTKNPTISVVTPSYNQEEYLEDAITSVINQTGVDLEYFVFDGGSSDGSVEIIKRHSKSISHWVSQKDRGQSDAINQGLRAVKGEILCWINSDDYLKAGALEVVSNFFRENPGIDWVVGGCELINDQENPHDIVWPPDEIRWMG